MTDKKNKFSVKKNKKDYSRKHLIEINSRKKGWKTVELIDRLDNNRIVIRMSNGQVIARKNIRTRGITRRWIKPGKI